MYNQTSDAQDLISHIVGSCDIHDVDLSDGETGDETMTDGDYTAEDTETTADEAEPTMDAEELARQVLQDVSVHRLFDEHEITSEYKTE